MPRLQRAGLENDDNTDLSCNCKFDLRQRLSFESRWTLGRVHHNVLKCETPSLYREVVIRVVVARCRVHQTDAAVTRRLVKYIENRCAAV